MEVWLWIVASLFIVTIILWKIYSLELAAFDKKKTEPKLSLYESFWSLLDFHDISTSLI